MEMLRFYVREIGNCQSRYLRGVRCRPVVARLLGLRFRISPGGIDVFSVGIVLCCTGKGPSDGPIPRPGVNGRVSACPCVCVCVCDQVEQ
jgi:hypothetical protein